MKKVGNVTLLSVIAAIIIIAGIVLAAVLGFNTDVSASSTKTLTVKVFATSTDSVRIDTVREICEKEIGALKVEDTYETRISGDTEVVYVFDGDTKASELNTLKEDVKKALITAKNDSASKLYGSYLYVTASTENVKATLPQGFVWRAIVAAVVVLVIQFVYVAIRFKLNMGIAAAISSFVLAVTTSEKPQAVRIF